MIVRGLPDYEKETLIKLYVRFEQGLESNPITDMMPDSEAQAIRERHLLDRNDRILPEVNDTAQFLMRTDSQYRDQYDRLTAIFEKRKTFAITADDVEKTLIRLTRDYGKNWAVTRDFSWWNVSHDVYPIRISFYTATNIYRPMVVSTNPFFLDKPFVSVEEFSKLLEGANHIAEWLNQHGKV